MRTRCAFTAWLILLICSSAMARTVTVDPSDPTQLVTASHTACRTDTVFLLPGTYVVGWPIYLTSDSPSYVGVGGPEGVILLGTGVEQAFFLDEFVWDAHIHLEGITFRGLSEIIGRDSPISSSGGEIRFINNIVEDCGTEPYGPALRTTACWGIVARSIFRNNHGPAIANYHTPAVIEDNEIYGNQEGITDYCCTSPPIRNNHVHDNLGRGIETGYYEGGAIEYNLIERNGGTGLAVGCVFTVQHNVIRGNARGVSSSSWVGSSAAIHYNDIHDNTDCNLRVSYEYDRTLDCTMNWWGSVDPLVIAAGIQDCYDDPELHVCVLFEPFCISPGCEPVSVEPSSWGSIKALFRE